MAFRDDRPRADWVDEYLRRVGELPVAARVEPGAVRAALPASPPEQGEPFEALLRDLDDLILPGLTHWNHPRFFAWFANTGSEPGILAELLIATLNVNNMTWLSSPAATELEVTVLDWLAQLLGLPRGWHGHIEDTASTATVAALAAARTRKPGGVVYASEQANISVEKAARLVGLEFRAVEVDDAFRMRPDFDLEDATAVVATVGTTGTTVGRSGARAGRPLRGGGRVAARRCGVCRVGRDLSRAPLVPRRRRSRRLRRGQSRTSGSSRPWTARRCGHGGRRPSTRRSPWCRTISPRPRRRST